MKRSDLWVYGLLLTAATVALLAIVLGVWLLAGYFGWTLTLVGIVVLIAGILGWGTGTGGGGGGGDGGGE